MTEPTTIKLPTSRRRHDAIDFWRGFVLCTIFINHVPGNLFENLTYRNIGFSDSAEAFVFISGVSLALAYGSRFFNGHRSTVLVAMARRAVKLYAVHIGLSLAGLAIFAAGAVFAENPDLMQMHGRDLFVDDPRAGLIGLLSLGHQLGYFNILPMYVVLVAVTPALLWLARSGSALMLSFSSGLYVLSRVSGLNIPTWPMKGEWFFDPFTWQLLMAIGLAVGLKLRTQSRFRSPALIWLCSGILLFSWFAVSDGFSLRPGMWDSVRGWADLDKGVLGAGRLIHFLALAYLIYAFDIAGRCRAASWYGPLCVLGRHGLWTFGLLSLLAALAQVLGDAFGHSVLLDTVMIGGGMALLFGSAAMLERGRAVAGLRVAVPHGKA